MNFMYNPDHQVHQRQILRAQWFLILLNLNDGNMAKFDFKRFHIRSMNAASDSERAEINKELKDLYAALSEDHQKVFNEELQQFLTGAVSRIKSDYESVKGLDRPN